GSRILIFEDKAYAPIAIDAGYVRKHKPVEGGYLVVYEDGYRSFSPAEAFEGGYTKIVGKPEVIGIPAFPCAAFWVTGVPEFDDLAPAEMLAGAPFRERTEPLTKFQWAHLHKPFQERFTRVRAEMERVQDV
ncbi:MAG TPA: hypothetical protein VM659_27665, partial [Dongiaceae bacterium]|nr:hypothetical protein [Dongiaceae bacterium]